MDRSCHRIRAFVLGWILLPAVVPAQTTPSNLDFEAGGAPGSVPSGWYTFTSPPNLGFRSMLMSDSCLQGRYCAVLSGPSNPDANSFGSLSQTIRANNYAGRTAVFRMAMRVDGNATRARLWIRVDRADGTMAGIINSADVTSSQWRYVIATLPVAADGANIYFGILNWGSGQVWVDDGSFQTASFDTPAPLPDTGLANLTAFGKMLGYVRHFHPSDQVEQVDWDEFAAYGVRTIENAGTPEDLAAGLQALFDPIAPTVRIFVTGSRPILPAELQPANTAGLQLVRWNNFGVFLGSGSNIYKSARERAPAGAPPEGFIDPRQPYEAAIGRGLSVMVPLTLYQDSGGTMPRRPTPAPHCCAYGTEDRATRLGGVLNAWNVAQHFYPYFDVVNTDWPAALVTALKSAATDSSTEAYFATLRRLWAALHDGHGFVSGPLSYTMVPLVWDWAEDQLVVTVVKNGQAQGVVVGDRVVKINDRPVEDILAAEEELISGATPQWIRYRALSLIAQCRDASRTMQLEIEPYASPGTRRTVQFTCGSDGSWMEPRPKVVQQLEPGIMYVDINSLTQAAWTAAIPDVTSAKGVVFDLRGYPQITSYLQYFANDTLNSAQWHIPIPSKPDRVDFAFHQDSSWVLPPLQPSISGRRVFLTDGRAISYAESEMGIVENYKIAEIVGSTTAGTNGNINYVYLPGGYSLGFTGMRVLKHDGSQHHGVGIHATIPVSRTRKAIAEGRDELLVRGVEVVKGAQPGPKPLINSVVNGASYSAGTAAPGEIVTIFGTNLGPAQGVKTSYDGSGFLGTYAGETRVFFDDIQAPLLYASSGQVNAIVPYQSSGTTAVRVEYQLRSSDPLQLTVAAAAPGVFPTILNQDGSSNSESNPAARGETVTLFATGTGKTTPAGVTGRMPANGQKPAGEVTVSFGGVPGAVQDIGEIFAGVLKLIVRVPKTAPPGSAVPVVLSVSGTASPSRAMIAVR